MNNLNGYVCDDELAIEPLQKAGWQTETISWRARNVVWKEFSCVIIRSTWDYQKHRKEFLSTLSIIESQTKLANPLEIVRWNLKKTYLQELQNLGVLIVPTHFSVAPIDPEFIKRQQTEFGTEELIIKPVVSATAEDTFRVNCFHPKLNTVFFKREYMVQPLIHSVIDEGEYSLFYFGGKFSHAILKSPKRGDFRVQEEWGGNITAIEPTAAMRKTSDFVLGKLQVELLYARVDLVRTSENKFALMELELIEPALYFRTDPAAPDFFAKAFTKQMLFT
ncbi:MAG: RimK family alpha-L-glutamate ligase [Pyrinomonadaceae bacterium]